MKMMMENCETLARAMFEKMKMTVDDEKSHYALHVLDEMLKTMRDMRFTIGGDLAKTFDLYAVIEVHPIVERFYVKNTQRIMFRLIYLYMQSRPQYEDDLRDVVFNLGIEEE